MSNVASSSTDVPVSTSDLPTVKKIKGLNSEKLNGFLKGRLNNIDNHINTITEKQEVDGDIFLNFTATDFERWGIPGEPAQKIERLIKEIIQGGVKRARLSIDLLPMDLLSNLKTIISPDESPITLIPFIARPQIEQKICNVINLNLFSKLGIPSPRIQDYRGIVISGGSGTGKTRIGFEINNIVERNNKTKERKERLNATFEHVYINMNEIKDLLGSGLDKDTNNNYPYIKEHIKGANKIILILILTYIFTKAWTDVKIRKAMEEVFYDIKGYEYEEVIELIRKEKKVNVSATLILVLQIDEFQSGNYWTIVLLRVIKSMILRVPKTIIIPICTGTAPSKIAKLGDNTFYLSSYGNISINLSPMNFKDSMSLFDEFTTHYYGNNHILPEKNERFYRCAVNSVRGIPVIIEIAVRTFIELEKKGIKAFQNFDTTKKYWESLKYRVNQKYPKQHWLLSLHNENNIIKLLYYIHIQKLVTKKDQLNDCTIEDLEASGFIYLEETNNNDMIFTLRIPLILIATLVDYFNLHSFFDTILLNPFILINQDNFSDFILHIHHATYGLMVHIGINSITLREIYGQNIIGPKEVLNHEIHVDTIEYHEQPTLIPKHINFKTFIRPGLNRKCVKVICSDTRRYQEIDATLGRYIIKTSRKNRSADAILPHADEQYKYSKALESGYSVHENKTGVLNVKDVKKEKKKACNTGAERLVIITPKGFDEKNKQNIPRNCAIVAGNDFVNFITIYAI